MSFTWLIFLLLFLPVFMILYLIMPDTGKRNIVLFVFSLIFYMFGGLKYLILILFMGLLGYLFGRLIGANVRESKSTAKFYLILSVIIFVAVLCVFKYTDFFLGNLGKVFDNVEPLNIVLPLGISFYVFKLISYVADVYREEVPAEKSILIFLTYIMTFHQVLQGPIVRYKDMRTDLHKRSVKREALTSGLFRFMIGLFKKAVLADYCGQLASTLAPMNENIANSPTMGIWLGSILFSMQLYLDFSAYSDMAIALGTMCGFHYPENFNFPYAAVSVRDFWRRWHISLSTFFRDYVYIPLGGSKCSTARTTLNLLVVWALTGFWHGAGWNFILWGLYYFLFIVIENAVRKRQGAPKKDRGGLHIPGRIYALLVINFGWVLFRFTDFSVLGTAVKGMFGGTAATAGFTSFTVETTVKNNIFFIIFAVLFSTPLFKKIDDAFVRARDTGRVPVPVFYIVRAAVAVTCFIVSIIAIAGGTFQAFLYNTF